MVCFYNCWVCGWNRKDWPFKWILLACTPSKIPSYSYHSESYLRIISGSLWNKKWGSFWGKDCFGVDLGIISGLGSLFFRLGSFQVLCRCKVINNWLIISPELTNDQPMTKLGSHVSKQALSSRSRFREGKWIFVFISSIPHPQESDEGYVRGRLSLTSCANRCNLCDRTYIFQPIREILVGWQGDLW